MKRYWLIFAVAVLLIVYLFIKNENYRNELKQTENKIAQLESSKEIIHFEAVEVAEKFILGYFDYQGKPLEKNVEMYVSKEVLKKLNFNSSGEYNEDMNEVNSSVTNLDVYLGKSVEGKQKLLGVFINQIEVNNTESLVDSFIELDLENTDNGWRIMNFHFFQY